MFFTYGPSTLELNPFLLIFQWLIFVRIEPLPFTYNKLLEIYIITLECMFKESMEEGLLVPENMRY